MVNFSAKLGYASGGRIMSLDSPSSEAKRSDGQLVDAELLITFLVRKSVRVELQGFRIHGLLMQDSPMDQPQDVSIALCIDGAD